MAKERRKQDSGSGSFREFLVTVLVAGCIAIFVRTFLFESFNIPSKSMMPTMLVGDYLFVSKFSYGYSRYSLPWGMHLFDGRKWSTSPKRGDVVVFKLPTDNSTDYIKRVVGLPGDHIQVIHRVLHINGEAVGRRQIEDYVERDRNIGAVRWKQFIERLPNGVEHPIMEAAGEEVPADNTPEFIVPAHHYFMMGDHRDNSMDSRFLGGVGYVPEINLVGHASIRYFSLDSTVAPWWALWSWPWSVRWSRNLTWIN